MAKYWSGCDRRKDHGLFIGRVVIAVRITGHVLVVVVIDVRITGQVLVMVVIAVRITGQILVMVVIAVRIMVTVWF